MSGGITLLAVGGFLIWRATRLAEKFTAFIYSVKNRRR